MSETFENITRRITLNMQDGDVDACIELMRELDPHELDELSELLRVAADTCNSKWKRLLSACVDMQPHDIAGDGWRRQTKAHKNLERLHKGNQGFSVK